jgi:hypothetical protein
MQLLGSALSAQATRFALNRICRPNEASDLQGSWNDQHNIATEWSILNRASRRSQNFCWCNVLYAVYSNKDVHFFFLVRNYTYWVPFRFVWCRATLTFFQLYTDLLIPEIYDYSNYIILALVLLWVNYAETIKLIINYYNLTENPLNYT